MGSRALLAVLLTTGMVAVPLFGTFAQEETSSSTPPSIPEGTAATSSTPDASNDTTGTSTASTTDSEGDFGSFSTFSSTQTPYERGFANAWVSAENFEEANPGYGAFAIEATLGGQTVTDGATITLPFGTTTVQFSASTTPIGTTAIDVDEIREIMDESLMTSVWIFRGTPENATQVLGNYAITSDGILSEAPPAGTPVDSIPVLDSTFTQPGDYFIVVAPMFSWNSYPTGWGPSEFGAPDGSAPKWDAWSAQDFFSITSGFQYGPQVFGILQFTVQEGDLVTDPCATEVCVSNVMFLPGIKGSNLYQQQAVCTNIECENKRWFPGSNADIESLFLNEEGRSINAIYAKETDIVGSVSLFGIDLDIYNSFTENMQMLQGSGAMNNWRAVAYDWRLSLENIVSSGSLAGSRISYQADTPTPYIEQTLRDLAATSKTGKVTIIAHSNGGLVAKALMQQLGDSETAALVDKVIFIGVPQSGAPQAIGGLLYGYKEALPWTWLQILMDSGTARQLAENAPSAYHLLPSAAYFSSVSDSNHQVVTFEAEQLYSAERAAYGSGIQDANELYDFLLASEGGRLKPSPNINWEANILNPFLIEYAENTHTTLDAWVPPSEVSIYQIAGWGVETLSGITYYERCILGLCRNFYRPKFTEDGDGVVPVLSALMMPVASNVSGYWVNLSEYNADNSNGEHTNLLELSPIRAFIEEVLHDSLDDLPEFIYAAQPSPDEAGKKLVFFLHSPLELELRDANGNRTGPDESGKISQEIPGSSYGVFGEVQYLIAPADGDYLLTLSGYDTGTFTLEIVEKEGGEQVASTAFTNLPSMAGTKATLQISGGIESASSLQVDVDGDETIDIELLPVEGETIVYQPVTTEPEPQEESPRSNGTRITRRSTELSTAGPASLPETVPAERIAFVPPEVIAEQIDQSITANPELAKTVVDEVRTTQAASALSAVAILGWYDSFSHGILGFFVEAWSPVLRVVMQLAGWISSIFVQ